MGGSRRNVGVAIDGKQEGSLRCDGNVLCLDSIGVNTLGEMLYYCFGRFCPWGTGPRVHRVSL